MIGCSPYLSDSKNLYTLPPIHFVQNLYIIGLDFIKVFVILAVSLRGCPTSKSEFQFQFAKFHIHFQRQGEPARKKAFVYDWRMWTTAELKDLLQEVGFKNTYVYCEGAGRVENGDSGPAPGESWVAYVVGRK